MVSKLSPNSLKNHRQPAARARLTVEALEERFVPSATGANPRDLTVMSRNIYVGGDLTPAIGAILTGDPGAIIAGVSQLWQDIQGTNFPERADAIAGEIAATNPDLIGLQEVSLVRSGAFDSFFGNPTQADHIEQDYLQILLGKLQSRGLHYQAVAVTNEFDAEFPGFTAPGVLKDIRLTDRDVILARTDLPTSELKLSNVQTGNYTFNVQIPLPGGQVFTELRGWNSVDAKVRGKEVRFVNTHLESDVAPVQVLQAAELLTGPANVSGNVVLAGDFNSPADGSGTPTYSLLVGAGFADAWTATHPGDSGYTYGNAANLRNPVPLSVSPQRIDLVLFRGDVTARSMDRVGEELTDRTVTGMWPSDHAGVVGTLGLHVRPANGKGTSAAPSVSRRGPGQPPAWQANIRAFAQEQAWSTELVDQVFANLKL